MIKGNLARNKYLTLLFLLISIIFYSFFYQHSITSMSQIFSDIDKGIQGAVSGEDIKLLSVITDIAKSMYFQIPMNLINTLFIIYLLSIPIFISNKIEKKIRKIDQANSNYSYIVSCLYTSVNIISIDFILKGIIMMVTEVSVDTLTGVFPIAYWLALALLQAYVFNIEFYKNNKLTFSPIITCSVYIIIGLSIKLILQ